MNKKMKIEKPKIGQGLESCYDLDELIKQDDVIYDKKISGCDVYDILDYRLRADTCIFENVNFENCDFTKADLTDVKFINCNLSNIKFSDSGVYRVSFEKCKLTGAIFDDCVLKQVSFNECLSRYSNYSMSKFENVEIINSDFSGAILSSIKQKNIYFIESNFDSVDFTRTSLNKVDFTSCDINNIELSLNDLKGAIFNTVQALDLTRFLEIKIK